MRSIRLTQNRFQGGRRMHPSPEAPFHCLRVFSSKINEEACNGARDYKNASAFRAWLSDKVNNEPLIGNYREKKGYDNLPDNQDRAANRINPTDRLWREGIGN